MLYDAIQRYSDFDQLKRILQADPYADPYGDSTGWTRQFGTDCDLRVFLEKGQNALQLQRTIPILAAHNPEVAGSSPASATKKVLKS